MLATCLLRRSSKLEDRNYLKFETLHSSFCHLASMHNSSISMNHLLKSIYLVQIFFNLLNQSVDKTSITMDIDDTNGEKELIVVGILVIGRIIKVISVFLLFCLRLVAWFIAPISIDLHIQDNFHHNYRHRHRHLSLSFSSASSSSSLSSLSNLHH